ncbi:MAG: DUF4097 family beta strand repeat-containing protein [Oscillospiraceae bacterium]|jgi:hypothetical protein|nr:DUF4097 family beta strand repeat-containing protein [Oscillospiraceae bacterium]
MTKDEFFAELASHLRGLPEAEVAEARAYYEEYFSDALESGQTEAEICAQLEPPAQIAARIRADLGGGPDGGDAENVETSGDPRYVELDITGARRISLGIITRDIEIVRGGSRAAMTLYTCVKDEFSALRFADGLVKVRVDKRWSGRHGRAYTRAVNRMSPEQRRLLIMLPDGAELDDVSVSTVSGTLTLRGLGVKEFHGNTVSTRVAVSGCTFARFLLNGVSGDVDMGDCAVETLTQHVISGNLRYRGTIGRSLTLDAVSGTLILTLPGALPQYTFRLSSVSGHILLDGGQRYRGGVGSGPVLIQAATVSGDMHVSLGGGA